VEVAELASRIDPDRLQIFVFGPGWGESIALRTPPGVWLVIDSCGGIGSEAETIPALQLLSAVGEPVEGVILTHPHGDHTVGLDLIIERFNPPLIGCVEHFIGPDLRHSANNGAQFDSEKARPAQAAIGRHWSQRPETKWEIRAGDVRQIGATEIQALHPPEPAIAAVAARQEPNPNDLSTPIAVSWQDARVVLGADLPEAYWPEAIDACNWDAPSHGGLKVAHHGSLKSQDGNLIAAADRERTWICTPWHGGGRHLPNYADTEGAEILLASNPELVVTSLTRKVAQLPEPLTRAALESAWVMKESKLGKLTPEKHTAEIAEAWALLSFTPDGVNHLETGTAALRVLP